MAVPPSYADLGKSARDIFGKGFNYGFFKLECKTKTKNGVEFTTNGSSVHDSGKVAGSLETKYKNSEYGVTLTEKWTTDNILSNEVTVEDQMLKGLKLTFDTQFAPQTGKKSGKVKAAYKRPYVNLNCDVDFDYSGPTIHGAFVTEYKGWLAGVQGSFDTSKSKLTKNNVALGYSGGDFTLHSAMVGAGEEFAGSYHQKINANLEAGVTLSWSTSSSSASKMSVGSKYIVDKDSSVRVKLNNAGQLGLALEQRINSGVKLTLSTLCEAKNFNQGGHKVGLGLDMEA